jgi:hypothetical protein
VGSKTEEGERGAGEEVSACVERGLRTRVYRVGFAVGKMRSLVLYQD